MALTYEANSIQISVRDDGVGFDPELTDGNGHLGLVTMRERAQQSGGHVRVSSSRGGGTEVVALLPTPAGRQP